MEIIKSDTFRSKGRKVNQDDDMVQAVVRFTKQEYMEFISKQKANNENKLNAIARDIINMPLTDYKLDDAVSEAISLDFDIEGKIVRAYKLGHRHARHAACEIIARELK